MITFNCGSLVQIQEVDDNGDERGHSYCLPHGHLNAFASAKDVHIASIWPGKVRGNHYHMHKTERLIVFSGDTWTLYWDNGPGSKTNERHFSGAKLTVLTIEPGAAHAILNTGTRELVFVGLSDHHYCLDAPDAHTRIIVPITPQKALTT